MSRLLFVTLIAALSITFGAGPALAGEFYLRGGEKVVFFGDSITQNGSYVTYVEAFLRTRFPDRPFQIINHGISSETLSNTSEPDHDPRRPCAHDRFDRDVAAEQPDVLVSCFGMNDGNYHPFDEERFEKYRQGVQRLLDRAKADAGNPRITILTPPPFDPYYRKASDPMAVDYGYKFAALDYDDVLTRYSKYLASLRSDTLLVADCHTPMNEHLRSRRQARVSWTFSPDAVHPNATGHLLMALAVLGSWNAPARAAAATLDVNKLGASDSQDRAGPLRDARREGEAIAFTWTRAPLPMPVDPAWEPESLALERFTERFNRYTLTVTGLGRGRYRLVSGDASIGVWTHDELAAGVDLSRAAEFAPVVAAKELLQKLQQRNAERYAAWRKHIAAPAETAPAETANEWKQAEAKAEAQSGLLRILAEPRDIKLTLSPAAE